MINMIDIPREILEIVFLFGVFFLGWTMSYVFNGRNDK